MPRASGIFRIWAAGGLLIIFLLMCMAGMALAWKFYPWAMGFLIAVLGVVSISSELRQTRWLVSILGSEVYPLDAGCENDYKGLYLPDWEVPQVLVLRGFRFFGVLPSFERWLPDFDCENSFPPVTRGTEGCRYLFHFRGIPSERGHFGHKGIANRRVVITSVTDSLEILPKDSFF